MTIPAIDTHIHIYDPARPQGVPWPPKSEPVLYRRHLASDFRQAIGGADVEGAVIVEASPWPSDNDWIILRAMHDPIFLCVVGHLEPGTPSFAAELARLRRAPLFRGIRVGARGLSAVSTPDLQRLADENLSLDVLVGPQHLPAAAELARGIPHLRIILNHLPLYPSPPALRQLAERPNIWIKVSGVMRRQQDGSVSDTVEPYREALDELWTLFGEKRLVYGSNWPVSNRLSSYSALIGVVRSYFATKSVAAQHAFFRDNARAVYLWPERQR